MAAHTEMSETLYKFKRLGDLALVQGHAKSAIMIYDWVLCDGGYSRDEEREVIYQLARAYHMDKQFETAVGKCIWALQPTYYGPDPEDHKSSLLHLQQAASLTRLCRFKEAQQSYDKFKEICTKKGFPITNDQVSVQLDIRQAVAIFKAMHLDEDDKDEEDSDKETQSGSSAAGSTTFRTFRGTISPPQPLSMARFNGSNIVYFGEENPGFFLGPGCRSDEIIILAPFLRYPSSEPGPRQGFKVHLATKDGTLISNYIKAIFRLAEKDAIGDSKPVQGFKRMARIHGDPSTSLAVIVTEKKRVLQIHPGATRRNLVQSSTWPPPKEHVMKFTDWSEKAQLSHSDEDHPQRNNERIIIHVIPKCNIKEWLKSLEKAKSLPGIGDGMDSPYPDFLMATGLNTRLSS